MGQREIMRFLNEKRLEGNTEYFTVKEIADNAEMDVKNAHRAIVKLNNVGALNRKVKWNPLRHTFRLDKDFVTLPPKITKGVKK